MIADFRQKGIAIPEQVMSDLKSAKTSLKILTADPNNEENLRKIDEYMTKVESFLVSEGQDKVGTEYAGKWLTLLHEAGMKKLDETEERPRFIAGAPRQKKWVRVSPTPEVQIDSLVEMADQMRLVHETQKDGSLLVCGDERGIKDFVKNLASKYKSQAEKYRKKVHNG
jgi:hypothetical protein